jgi:two-component system OmpR family sensor kinase
MIIGGIVSGAIAFFQARELQDNTLTEISLLLKNGTLNPPEQSSTLQAALNNIKKLSSQVNNKADNGDIEEDTSIIIFEIKAPFATKQEQVLSKKRDGLQTINLQGEQWRALLVTQQQSIRKFLIAQPTELRDEIAVSSAISTLYPLLIFVVCLLVLVHFVLRRQFKPIQALTKNLDQQGSDNLEVLSENKVPKEILPFVRSINALIERVQSAMAKQQRFIADAAHELRTPIAALSLQTENVRNATSEQERDERLASLQQGFLRLGNLISQLLDLARLQANSEISELKTDSVSLNEKVKHVIQNLYPLAEKGKVDIGVIRQDEKVMVNDSNGLLSQLIQNAISNAIQYTPEGGEVNISILKENNHAVFLVEDTGCGIPEKELEKVMEPFYRVQANKKDGNGLGLTISQEIADKLGGKILLANREGNGLIYRYEQGINK